MRDAVDRGEDVAEVVERDEGHGVGADVPAHADVVTDDAPLRVDAERRFDGRIAPLEIGEERLAAARRPAHRPAESLRRPTNDDLFWLQISARAEGAADVARHYSHALGTQHSGKQAAQEEHALAAGDERVTLPVPLAERGARLHLAVGDALA